MMSTVLAAVVASGGYTVGSGVDLHAASAGFSGGTSSRNISPPRGVVQAQEAGTAVDPQLAASDNAFGFDLFKTLMQDNTGNIAISPISVALALQIAYNGAAGTTQQAMAQTLRLGPLTTPELNTANAALQASLIRVDTRSQLTIANSLWTQLRKNPILSSFTQTVKTYYGGTVGDLSGAPANVNAWIARETDGLITQILSPAPAGYYAKVTAIIVNAIYFKGQWSKAFDAGSPVSAPFTLSDDTKTSSDMMHQSGHYEYLQGANFQVLRIPYGRGSLSMLIVLPNAGVTLRSFITDITVDDLNSWIGRLHGTLGTIALPRFTSTYRTSLPGALTSLGMGIAFCGSPSADCSGIGAGYCLSDVEHEAVVTVNEIGTVAAAATAVGFQTEMVQAFQFTMTMDHPFLYAIRDDKTRELLFIGALERPK